MLLEKQGQTHIWRSSMDPPHMDVPVLTDHKILFTWALCGHWMLSGRPIGSDVWERRGRENQGNSCKQRELMWIYIYIYVCVCVCVCVRGGGSCICVCVHVCVYTSGFYNLLTANLIYTIIYTHLNFRTHTRTHYIYSAFILHFLHQKMWHKVILKRFENTLHALTGGRAKTKRIQYVPLSSHSWE